MLARCLRRWPNINPSLTHVSGGMWWVPHSAFMPEVKLGSYRKNLSRKSPLQYVDSTQLQQGRPATSGVASLAGEDELPQHRSHAKYRHLTIIIYWGSAQ